MVWWAWVIGIIALLVTIIVIIRKINGEEESIFSQAGRRIKKIGDCCKRWFGA